MQLISRARARDRSSGRPLKTVFQTWKDAGVHLRRGQVHLIASGPGVGKSALALTIAVRSEARGIYFSADSDVATQYARLAAMLTGEPVSRVNEAIERKNTAEFDKHVDGFTRIRFEFDAAPSLTTIEENVWCYADIHGRWPELVILDNLGNGIDDSGGDGFVALENILAFLHELARKTKACVVVLHHLVGMWEDGVTPAPLSGLRGKVSKISVLVINLYREADDDGFGPERLGCAIVKNRGGKASAAGRYCVSLNLDLERMDISDIEEPESNFWEKEAV
ncbi:DnaB-like helicase C-terminal domain-containing protein [Actinomadura rubrisoli]|uniref:SF4 helicase domain-containing protein n=1 Tax=Actinomadura rubrisoli TaxID=2530368 RepID=A0A4R5CE82_9ACTN|nr:DnaB-like helicase C-terminal domain-containing protein [Actinomadura rubrisoli]TDD97226.1 hypothetical protein E1298_01965 [Actinomadura rubrisoli]